MAGTRRKNSNKKTTSVIETPKKEKRKCTCCGTRKDFYLTKSYLYQHTGELPFCKDCIDDEYERLLERFNYNTEKAIYNLCIKLDLPYYASVYNGAKNQVENKGGKLNRIYIQKINSFREANSYGNEFIDGERLIEEIPEDDKTMEFHKKWGKLSIEDIEYLEEQYKDWTTRYDVSTKSMELLVQEICYQQLQIKKKRETNQPVSKELKDLQDLMNSSALKPIQETAVMGADLNTLGTWIKKFENEKPFPEPDPDFRDVDGIKKYIRIYFLGHFCKMLGLNNEYAREYDEEMMKYQVEMPDDSFNEDVGDEDGME